MSRTIVTPMSALLTGAVIFLIETGISAPVAFAEEPESPAAKLVYLGTSKSEPVAVFKIENVSTTPILISTGGDWWLDAMIDRATENGEWKVVEGWNWCGNGKKTRTIEPQRSTKLALDVEKYVGKSDSKFRVGIFIRAKNEDSNGKIELIWSDPVVFPEAPAKPRVPPKSSVTNRASEKRKTTSASTTKRRCLCRKPRG